MPKANIHAQIDAEKFGGKMEDYLAIHEWFDDTKSAIADNRHRCLKHHSLGIFWAAQIFGDYITNSDGKQVSVRDIGESHVLVDFGGKFIPTPQDYIQEMEFKDWMQNGKGNPPSCAKIFENKAKKRRLIDGD